MMSAKESDAQENAGPGGAGDGPFAVYGAQKEHQNKRCPNGAVQHLRPRVGSHKSAESEGQAREQGSSLRPFQIPAQPITEQRRLNVNEHEIPMQAGLAYPSVPQRGQKQQPVDRVS